MIWPRSATSLKTIAVAPVKFSAFTNNPAYHPSEVLPDVQDNGTTLDVSAWKFRKPIKVVRAGAQQLELDLDVLSHAQAGFEDLRLMRDGKQVSYIIERTSIQRALTPDVTVTNDARNPKLSRWILKLPRSAFARHSIAVQIPHAAISTRDDGSTKSFPTNAATNTSIPLASASWTQTPGAPTEKNSR